MLTPAENSLQNFISSARRRWGQGQAQRMEVVGEAWTSMAMRLRPPRPPLPPAWTACHPVHPSASKAAPLRAPSGFAAHVWGHGRGQKRSRLRN